MKRAAKDIGENVRLARQEAILELISDEAVSTQVELTDRLNEMGFKTTQATISRDIKELKLVKAAMPDGGYRYQVSKTNDKYPISHKFYSLFRDSVTHVDYALNQVIITCYTGMAQAICATMDGLEWPGVLGTIAGDDTVLIITKSETSAAELTDKLRELY